MLHAIKSVFTAGKYIIVALGNVATFAIEYI